MSYSVKELKNLEERRTKLNSIVAPNVKRIIKQKCLKQSAVADRAGYTPNQFCSMMKGRKVIKDIDIMNIANALGVDANELFRKDEQPMDKNTVDLTANVNIEEAEAKVSHLVELLKEASALVDELASKGIKLEVNI